MPEPFFALTEESGKAWVNIILNVGTVITSVLTLVFIHSKERRSTTQRDRLETKVDRVDAQVNTVVLQSNGLLLQAKQNAMAAARALADKTGETVHRILAEEAERDYLNYKKIEELKKGMPHHLP